MRDDTRSRAFGSKVGVTLLTGVALLLTSCANPTGEPSVELNPHPTQHYTIDASIIGAPGPFDEVEAEAVYEVEDRSCVPLTPISGARITPRHEIPLSVTKSGETYRTSFTADAVLDGDYYGHGVCHWTLSLVSVAAVVQNRRFVTVIPPVGRYAKGSVTTYFSRRSFNHASKSLIDTGLYDKAGFDHPDETFQINLVARKATP